MMDTAISEKREVFFTFYDVKKAYDNVDNQDLLVTMWEKGLRGKSWRILKQLNENLKSIIKTRFGPTREVNMEVGGKQGSRLTGRMFAKMMDLISEELMQTDLGFQINEELIIAVLLWVDDVITCTEGITNQEEILKRMDEFATRHKIKWGQSKCNVMRVGRHTDKPREWKIGEMTIEETTKYKNLGDVITSDGKRRKFENEKHESSGYYDSYK